MTDAIKLAIEALEAAPRFIVDTSNTGRAYLEQCNSALAALRAQPASQYLCNATRFKVAVRNGEAMLPCLPDELGGRWVALVAAEDDCHLRAQPDHSEQHLGMVAGWIDASKQMPPPQVRVLGLDPQHNIVEVDMWFGPDFQWGYSHWMPLPPPPAIGETME